MAKKSMVKSTSKSEIKTPSSHDPINKLIESNIELQHKMVDVLIGVKELNENVSSMVTLFKSAGEHIKSGKYEDPMINKLNELLDQNKNLTKALELLENYVKSKQPPTQY